MATSGPTVDLSEPSVRDDGWPRVDPRIPWEAQGLAGYDGIVWYRRTIETPPGETLSLLVDAPRHGWIEIYADGVSVGRVGSADDPYPLPGPERLDLPVSLTGDGTVLLAVRMDRVDWLSRKVAAEQGAWTGLRIGPRGALVDQERLERLSARQDRLHVLVLGTLFLAAGVYHVVLFLVGRPAPTAYLWFGLGSILFGINALAASPWISAFFRSFEAAIRTAEVAGHLTVAALISFLWQILDRPVGRLLRGYQISHLVLAGLVLVSPFSWVVITEPARLLWLVPILLAALVVLQQESARGHPDAKVLAVGGSVLVTAEVAELLRVFGAPFPTGLNHIGFAVVLLTMVIALAHRFSRARTRLDQLNKELESRVDSRTAELVELAEQAEAANRAKTRFLSMMSHELRTPLNSVIGFTRVVLKKRGQQLVERDWHFLERVHYAGQHLLDLIDEVLDLARIEEDRLEVDLQDGVDVGKIVRRVLEDLEPALYERNVTVRSVVPQDLVPIRTDAVRLRQVLRSIAGNAVKFTPEGVVTLAVYADEGRPTVLEVRDTGIGIPADDLERILEPFEQADASTTRKYGGLGLGLAISREICDLLGYRLDVESEPGSGTTFRILLPPTPAAPAPPSPAELHTEKTSLPQDDEGHLVLIIDDDPDARELMDELLSDLGCRTVPAGSGEEGLKLARKLRPDLVTLDLRMPGLDGWTVLRAFREDEVLSDIPVIVVSVVAEEQRGEILGPVELVSKPIEPEDLLRAVSRQWGKSAKRTLIVDDDPDARALLGEPLEEMGAEIREAGNGREALDILEDYVPDLILLDLVMPGMDGFEFLEYLRRDPALARLPVVIVTSKELDREEVRLLRQTSQGLVRKSRRMGLDGLQERLERYLGEPEDAD